MNKNRKGLTLVEVLAVLAIISLLFVLLIPSINSAIDKTKMLDVKKDFKKYHEAATLYIEKKNGEFDEQGYNDFLEKDLAFKQGKNDSPHMFKDVYKLIMTNKSIIIYTKVKNKEYFLSISRDAYCNQLNEECLLDINDGEVIYDPNNKFPGIADQIETRMKISVLEKNYPNYKVLIEFLPNERNIVEKKYSKGIVNVAFFDGGGITYEENEIILNETGTYTFYYKTKQGKERMMTHDVTFDLTNPIVANVTERNVWSSSNALFDVEVSYPHGVKEKKIAIGTQNIDYFLNGGERIINDEFSVSENGNYTLYIETIDGNKNIFPFVATKIDKTAPSITLEENNEWKKEHTVTIDAIDVLSGVQKIEYSWTKSETMPTSWLSTNKNIVSRHSEQGEWHLHVKVTDNVGNVGYGKSMYMFDNEPPSFELQLQHENRQYSGIPVQLGIYSSKSVTPYVQDVYDEGSGTRKKEYRIFHWTRNDQTSREIEGWTEFQGAVPTPIGKNKDLHPSGYYYLQVRMEDFSGNSRIATSQSFGIDNTKPKVEPIKVHSGEWTNLQGPIYSRYIYDEHTGVAQMEYDSRWAVYNLHKYTRTPITTRIEIDDDDAYSNTESYNLAQLLNDGILVNGEDNYVNVQASDAVGNIEIKSLQLKIDTITPKLNLSQDSSWKKSHTVKINAEDTLSGVDAVQYGWTNSQTTKPTDWIIATSNEVTESTLNGVWYLHVRVFDKVGLMRYDVAERKFDNSGPTISLTYNSTDETIDYAINDISNVSAIKADIGTRNATYFGNGGITTTGGKLYINKNGTYTFYAKDTLGNETVKTIAVSGIPTYNADGDFMYSSANNKTIINNYKGTSSVLKIPKNLGWNPVVSFAAYAFSDKQLTSVTIPNSVTSVGFAVFQYNQLTSVTIPNSVTSIDTNAFYSNKLTSVTIPNSVRLIGAGAFVSNQLTSINIPNSVTLIGEGAFAHNQLTSVTIPNSVTSIGASAFYYNQLTSVMITKSVTYIGSEAFYENSSLSTVTNCSNLNVTSYFDSSPNINLNGC